MAPKRKRAQKKKKRKETLAYKILILGDPGVGKAQIVKQFADARLDENLTSGIGIDFASKIVEFEDFRMILTIWDINPTENLRFFRRYNYTGSHGAIFVFDLSKKQTFENLEAQIIEYLSFEGFKPIVIVGNKADLDKEITGDELKPLLDKFQCNYIEMSATRRKTI